MKNVFVIAMLVIGLGLLGCKSKEQQNEPITKNNTKEEVTKVDETKFEGYTKGTIIDKTGLDGCTFVIKVREDKHFEPINLDEAFMQDGLTVYFKYRLSRAASICMFGQPIVLSEIVKSNY